MICLWWRSPYGVCTDRKIRSGPRITVPGVKPLGALLLVLGLCVGAGLALWPTSVTIFGTEVDCSSPIR
jgi:hypothetical protein